MMPYVVGMHAGQPIRILNLDPQIHNVRWKLKGTGQQIKANRTIQPHEKLSLEVEKATARERLQTDTAPRMSTYLSAFDHPWFAVTDSNGVYHLPTSLPGEREICAQHRNRTIRQQQVIDNDGHSPPKALDCSLRERRPRRLRTLPPEPKIPAE